MNYMKPRAPCTSLNNNRCIKGVEFSRLCAGKGSTSMKHPQCSLAFCSFILVPHGNGIYLGRQGQTTQGIYMAFGRGFDAEENQILSGCSTRLSAVYFICMEPYHLGLIAIATSNRARQKLAKVWHPLDLDLEAAARYSPILGVISPFPCPP